MISPAEQARNLVAEMTIELDRFQKAMPITVFNSAALAMAYMRDERFDDAESNARLVLAALRGLPRGAAELTERETIVLQALVVESEAVTREMRDALRDANNPDLVDDVAQHDELVGVLESLKGKLELSKSIYVVTDDSAGETQ